MSEILCTFPGRYGDLLWALPTVREISIYYGRQVDLQIAGEFASIAPLIERQPYIHKVYPDPVWGLTPPDEWLALKLAPGIEHIHVHHLGYRGWPDKPLAQFIYDQQVRAGFGDDLGALDLTAPWIAVPPAPTPPSYRFPYVYGFSEAHFELKYGLVQLLEAPPKLWLGRFRLGPTAICHGARWQVDTTWEEAATLLTCTQLFLGDCSALHVLACAMGKTVLLMEPMEARWNDIFYPCGKTGRVHLICGNDGLPTFDARHVRDEVSKRLPA